MQQTRTQMFIATSDATPTELTIDGQTPSAGNRYTIAPGRSYAITLSVYACDSTAATNGFFKRMFIIQQAGGAVSLVGTPQVIGTDINPDSLAIAIQADNTNKALQIVVTGLASKSIRWIADVEALELLYASAPPAPSMARSAARRARPARAASLNSGRRV
ncbi:MAG TPA: hypothetical protein VF278_02900 [Pirellulales bacterium]